MGNEQEVKKTIDFKEKELKLLDDMKVIKELIKSNINTGETTVIKEDFELDVVNYLRKITGIEFNHFITDDESVSLLPIMLKPSHVLCASVVISNYKSIKENVVEFENQDIVNYVIGYNMRDTQLDIGRIVHFGSNVVPLEIIYKDNINDVEQIKKRITDNEQIIVNSNWFTSKVGASQAIELNKQGKNIGDKYILETQKVKLVKIMSYNMALITGITPFTKQEDIKLYTRLR